MRENILGHLLLKIMKGISLFSVSFPLCMRTFAMIALHTVYDCCCFLGQACQLPLFEYLVERMCSLCYDRAWYAKCGG